MRRSGRSSTRPRRSGPRRRPTDEAAIGACGALFFRAASPRDARRLSCELLRRGVDRAAILEQGWPAPEAVQEDTECGAARGDGNDVARLLEKALDDGDLQKVAALDPSQLVEFVGTRYETCLT